MRSFGGLSTSPLASEPAKRRLGECIDIDGHRLSETIEIDVGADEGSAMVCEAGQHLHPRWGQVVTIDEHPQICVGVVEDGASLLGGVSVNHLGTEQLAEMVGMGVNGPGQDEPRAGFRAQMVGSTTGLRMDGRDEFRPLCWAREAIQEQSGSRNPGPLAFGSFISSRA